MKTIQGGEWSTCTYNIGNCVVIRWMKLSLFIFLATISRKANKKACVKSPFLSLQKQHNKDWCLNVSVALTSVNKQLFCRSFEEVPVVRNIVGAAIFGIRSTRLSSLSCLIFFKTMNKIMRCVTFLFSSDFRPYLAGSYLCHRSSGVYVITATIIPLIIKNTCNIWRPQLFRTNL